MTLAVIYIYLAFGDSRLLKITPDNFSYLAVTDQIDGGQSTVQLKRVNRSILLSCQLKESSYAWPYCGLSIFTSNDRTRGIDLSLYHSIHLDIDYPNTGAFKPKLRVYLRNYNPAYSNQENEYTVKYNGVQFLPNETEGVLTIPIQNLQVMTWWLADNDISIEHSAPEFTNITAIELATGSDTPLGPVDIQINSIEFEGDYIKGETLFLGLLMMWMSVSIGYMLYELRNSQQLISQVRARRDHLQSVNQTLRTQNVEFSELAHKDALTGALNRHAIRDWLSEQSRKVRWNSGSLSLLYLDIDLFKDVNDNYGHKVGDDLLKEFSMVVGSELNDDARLVRWGGEEFIIFCPDTDLDAAIELASKIRLLVERHIWVHGDELTCSIGVAQMGDERSTETIARADEALYKAKHNGRNCVEVNYGLIRQ